MTGSRRGVCARGQGGGNPARTRFGGGRTAAAHRMHVRKAPGVGRRRRRRRCNGGRRLVILEAGKNVERRKGFAAGRGLRKTGRGGLRSIVFSALVRYGRGRVGIRLLSPVRGRGIGPFDTFCPVILWLGLRALIGTGSKCAAVPYRAKEPFCLACNRTIS